MTFDDAAERVEKLAKEPRCMACPQGEAHCDACRDAEALRLVLERAKEPRRGLKDGVLLAANHLAGLERPIFADGLDEEFALVDRWHAIKCEEHRKRATRYTLGEDERGTLNDLKRFTRRSEGSLFGIRWAEIHQALTAALSLQEPFTVGELERLTEWARLAALEAGPSWDQPDFDLEVKLRAYIEARKEVNAEPR